MIISMSDLICVTNRHLCRGDFLKRIEDIASARPAAILLREKDLTESAYQKLAGSVMQICRTYGTLCILHTFVNAAKELHAPALHLPLSVLGTLSSEEKAGFPMLGASCHSAADARMAQQLGCTYLTAGHIFDTDCKKGLPGRGTGFLEEICSCVSVPVYAIGGIRPDNIAKVRTCRAAGACIMSGPMRCTDVQKYLSAFDIAEKPL